MNKKGLSTEKVGSVGGRDKLARNKRGKSITNFQE
jgi:hypothetical protein